MIQDPALNSAIEHTKQRILQLMPAVGTDASCIYYLNAEIFVLNTQLGLAAYIEDIAAGLPVTQQYFRGLCDTLSVFLAAEVSASERIKLIYKYGTQIVLIKLLLDLKNQVLNMQVMRHDINYILSAIERLNNLMTLEIEELPCKNVIDFTDTWFFADFMCLTIETYETNLLAAAVQSGARVKSFATEFLTSTMHNAWHSGFAFEAQMIYLLIYGQPNKKLLANTVAPEIEIGILNLLHTKPLVFSIDTSTISRTLRPPLLLEDAKPSTCTIEIIEEHDTTEAASSDVSRKPNKKHKKRKPKQNLAIAEVTPLEAQVLEAPALRLFNAVQELSADTVKYLFIAYPNLNIVDLLLSKYADALKFKRKNINKPLNEFLAFVAKIKVPLRQAVIILIDPNIEHNFKIAILNHCLQVRPLSMVDANRIVDLVPVCNAILTPKRNSNKESSASLPLKILSHFDRNMSELKKVLKSPSIKERAFDQLLAIMENMPSNLEHLSLLLGHKFAAEVQQHLDSKAVNEIKLATDNLGQNFLHLLVYNYQEDTIIKVLDKIKEHDPHCITAIAIFAPDKNGKSPWNLVEEKSTYCPNLLAVFTTMIALYLRINLQHKPTISMTEIFPGRMDVFANGLSKNYIAELFKRENYLLLARIINERFLFRSCFVGVLVEYNSRAKIEQDIVALTLLMGSDDFHEVFIGEHRFLNRILDDIYQRPELRQKYEIIITAKAFTHAMLELNIADTLVWQEIVQIMRLSNDKQTEQQAKLERLLQNIKLYVEWGARINRGEPNILEVALAAQNNSVVEFLQNECGSITQPRILIAKPIF